MSDNLRHWSALGRTDPAHTKTFQRAGGFKGTATRPIWNEMRLTEHFGPCGIGWGCDEPKFSLVPAGDELLVFCVLRCWYRDASDAMENVIWGIGGDKVLAKRQSGPAFSDDEAYKKAFTDALGNAFKHVGMNADIHMGLFEDSKYRDEVAREFAGEPAAPAPAPAPAPNGRAAIDKAARAHAEAARKRIRAALEAAKEPRVIDEIISINGSDLDAIKTLYVPSYDALMTFAANRKAFLYGETG